MRYIVFLIILLTSMHTKEINMQDFMEKGFVNKHEFTGLYNDKQVVLTRYTKTKELNLYGEHVSFVFSGDTLISHAKMYQSSNKKPEFSKEVAQKIALTFVKKRKPELLENYKVLWVDFHEENLKINNENLTITGLKVKCQNLNDKKYFWVILSADKKIMAFESEVIWDFLRASRVSEKYIHDSFLEKITSK